MTIFNTKKLRIASFKGVEFHYQDSTIDGGRKTVTHEYPDSRIRYVEDLGQLEKTFSITAIIMQIIAIEMLLLTFWKKKVLVY
jgi:prophage DNA circulation protein